MVPGEIAVGKFVKTRGLKGVLKAVAYSGVPERFLGLKTLYVHSDVGREGYVVQNVEIGSSLAFLKLKGIEDRESAKKLVNREILLPENQKIDLPEDTYFIHDLIGLQVFDTQQRFLGEIKNVLTNSGNDVAVIATERKEWLLPLVAEFVREIDLSAGRMMVRLIDGLLEEENK